MAKVLVTQCFWGNGSAKELKETFVYRGYYVVKGGARAFHTDHRVRKGTWVENIRDNDEFNMAHTTFDSPDYFKEVVDEHIDYLKSAYPSLRQYYRLNSGEF